MAGKGTISIVFKLDGDNKGFKSLAADAEGLRKAMTATIETAAGFNNSFSNLGRAAKSVSLATFAASLSQVNNSLKEFSAEGVSYSDAMKAVASIAGKSAGEIEGLKEQVTQLSKSIPVAREQLARGLYEVISGDVSDESWISFLENSAKTSVGAIANLEEVIQVTTTVIKNYGLEWESAAEIQDKIQLTAKNGVTTFEQMAQALPKVTANAATLGVTIDELLSTFATLTGVSGNTAEVSTQLAAVFSALVKPSKQAAKMAEQMGIQFDAAAIKASGSMSNFLLQLDRDVKRYSARSGMLEQEIYGRLFGSAEALRALIPLNGELADKFKENTAAMAQSAGTIDEAFAHLSTTSTALTQKFKNQFSAVTDAVTAVVGGIAPHLEFATSIVLLTANVGAAITAVKSLSLANVILTARTAATSLAVKVSTAVMSVGSATARLFSGSLRSASVSANVLKWSLRGLVSATIVGAAIAALSYVVEKLVLSFDDTADSAEHAVAGIDEVKEAAKQAQRAFADTQAREYGRLMGSYTALREQWKALTKAHERARWVEKNADAFNELGLKIHNVIDADAVFNKNTDAVVKAFAARAEAAAHAAKLVELYGRKIELETQINTANAEAQKRNTVTVGQRVKKGFSQTGGHTTQGGFETLDSNGHWVYTEKGASVVNSMRYFANSGQDKARRAELEQVNTAINTHAKGEYQASQKARELSGASTKLRGKSEDKKNSTRDTILAGDSYAVLSHNLDVYRRRLEATSPTNKKQIQELKAIIATTEEAAQRARDFLDGLNVGSPQTLEEYDAALSRLRERRKTATASNIGAIDAEIKKLEDGREVLEHGVFTPDPIESLTTYEQINRQVEYYTQLLKDADSEQRKAIQEQLHRLGALKNAWEKAAQYTQAPKGIDKLNTLDDIENAIRHYEELQREASADEVTNIQRTIEALERKRSALNRGVSIVTAQQEVSEIEKLSGKAYKIEIKGIGFEELTKKIKDLQKLLSDTENPLTDAQRKDVEGLISIYNKWRKEASQGVDTYRKGWEEVQRLGGGIASINSALSENANAWQMVTGIVNGAFQVFDAVRGIIDLINTFTAVVSAQAPAQTAAATATSANTTAQATNAAAALPAAAANKALTASYLELAAAAYFAAHASIPFAGYGIGLGFATSAKASALAMGATPFAKGGIVHGATLGLIGEYAGASNNPEVVSPLSELRKLLPEPQEGFSGSVRFKIEGRSLVGVLANETRIGSKSGRRTNIKV